MTWNIHEGGIQTYKVAHKMRQKDGTVLAVAIRIEQALLAEERAVVTPYLVVELIIKSRLHPIQQACNSLILRVSSKTAHGY